LKKFEVLAAGLSDAAAIATLVNSAYRGESARQGWTTEADLLDGSRTDSDAIADLITSGVLILKYVEDNKILGCVELKVLPEGMYLGMLTVKPDLQNKGIGKILLAAAENVAKEKNCKAIVMTVITVRKELLDWYHRHGYRDTGKRKPFAFTDPRFGIPHMPLEFAVLKKDI
jgi:ribosomal protein S18 acetylase RimI-like enzyme